MPKAITTRELLAFVHIEKAAGTTLNHILRTNFLFKHCDVRPFSKKSNKVFQIDDLRIILRINPAVRCISGHSISPNADLETLCPKVKYITLLRNPVKRYLSQFQYWREGLNEEISFERFLDRKHSYNSQTKKIGGTADLNKAKEILAEKFFLVGIVEEFDEFLLMLKKKLYPYEFYTDYRRQNIGSQQTPTQNILSELYEKHLNGIKERNELDIELYDFVKTKILPRERKNYGPTLSKDKFEFHQNLQTFKWDMMRYCDYVYRKVYFDPVTMVIRKCNGLPPKGSY